MATPHHYSAIALIIKYGEKQFQRTLTESEIYALLAKTCKRLDLKVSSQGHGLPDLTLMYKNC